MRNTNRRKISAKDKNIVINIVVIAIIFLVATILVLAAIKPNELHVERSVKIKASPEKIFHLIDDLQEWETWTPYDRDPGMREAYSGPTRGVGARYAWEGNREVGQGSIRITKSEPHAKIALDMDMVKPFRSHNKMVFSLHAFRDGTQVTWAWDNNTSYAGKVMRVLMNLDKKIDSDFELGLTRLKNVAERKRESICLTWDKLRGAIDHGDRRPSRNAEMFE
jgi:uncharacterized protein YndB with AHSA1/START domain